MPVGQDGPAASIVRNAGCVYAVAWLWTRQGERAVHGSLDGGTHVDDELRRVVVPFVTFLRSVFIAELASRGHRRSRAAAGRCAFLNRRRVECRRIGLVAAGRIQER